MVSRPDAPPPATQGESVQAEAAKPVAAPEPAPAVTPATQVEPQVPVQAPIPPAPPAADVNRPFNPADALAHVYDLREPDHRVDVSLENTTVRVGKDKLKFRVQSDKPGYLYILMLGTDKQHIYLLFPNSLDQKNQTKANEPINLPRTGWTMTAGGPPGTNEFIALVSERPRNFKQVGLTKVGPFAELSLDNLAALIRSNSGNTAVLAGTPVCASGSPCSAAYGAARFTIEEVN
jgi:hypothetical protein